MKKNKRNKLTKKYKVKVLRNIFAFSPMDIDKMASKTNPIQKGDQLLVESFNMLDPRLMPNACDNEIYYEYGYLGTTLFLLQSIEFGKNYVHKDCFLYPALFCFRQYIENIIKVILQKYDKSEIIGVKHDIKEAWTRLLKYIDEEDENIKAVGDVIYELYEIDEQATAFRYPAILNQQFKQRSSLGSLFVDIRKLRTRVLQVYTFFDGLYELACRKNTN